MYDKFAGGIKRGYAWLISEATLLLKTTLKTVGNKENLKLENNINKVFHHFWKRLVDILNK